MRGWVIVCDSVSRGLHLYVLACVCVLHVHACMWLEASVALVCTLDSLYAGSVATGVSMETL